MSNIDKLLNSEAGQNTLGQLMDLLSKMPMHSVKSVSTKCKCAACGGDTDLLQARHRKSELSPAPILEPLCSKACETGTKGLCLLACARCRVVIGYVKPGKDSKLGFAFEAGKLLHVPACPVCLPELLTPEGRKIPTFILEAKVQECRQKNINPSDYIRSWWASTRDTLGLPPLTFKDWIANPSNPTKP